MTAITTITDVVAYFLFEMLLTNNFFLSSPQFPRWNNYFYFLFHSIANYYKLPFGAVLCDEIRMTFMSCQENPQMLSIVYASASLLISLECSFHIFVSLHDKRRRRIVVTTVLCRKVEGVEMNGRITSSYMGE